jgi:predicted DNA-binding WGR domain protein
MTEQATLFGAVDLIVEWGRLGRVPKVRIERFASPTALFKRRRELLARRRRHGYQEAAQPECLEETSSLAWPTETMWPSDADLPDAR